MKRIIGVITAASSAAIALAADLPFYKEGSATPSRVPAAEQTSANSSTLDSRAVQSATSTPARFDSNGQPGLAIFFR